MSGIVILDPVDVADLSTRERILAAAQRIIVGEREEAASMKAIAKAAGISRQAVYLHFADRSKLLQALVDYVDQSAGFANWRQDVLREREGHLRLRRLAEARCARSGVVKELVRAVEGARHRDSAALQAWRNRFRSNVNWISEHIVGRLAEEGRIHESWSRKDAASLLVVMFSFRAWDDLTRDAGWSAQHYTETLTAAALCALAGPANNHNKDMRQHGTP
jgi:AcrR family transcriptional regulator